MQSCLPCQQFFFCFNIHFIRNTAIYRTNRRTLWFFMKSLAFSTFIRYDKINFVGNRLLFFIHRHNPAVFQRIFTTNIGTIFDRPLNAAFINSIIRAFRLTCPTIYTFIGYSDCHLLYFCTNIYIGHKIDKRKTIIYS